MINLRVVDPNGYYVALGQNYLFGPFRQNGDSSEQIISFRHPHDRIEEKRRLILEEGNVHHSQMGGDILLNPSLSRFSLMDSKKSYVHPKTRYMRLRSVHLDRMQSFDAVYYPDLMSGWCYDDGKYDKSPTVIDEVNSHGFTRWNYYHGNRSYTKETFTVSSFTRRGASVTCTYKRARISGSFGSLDLDDPEAFKRTIERAIAASPNAEEGSYTSTYLTTYIVSGEKLPVAPSKIRGTISQLNPLLLQRNSPGIVLTDFGDLAMKACEQLDAINANLIAFVRDLPSTKDLVPKLKNLSQLKTHASNYLAVNYGVLPTISDLEEIFSYFKNKAPRDRDGRKLVYSSDIKTSRLGSVEFRKERRIKIAVDPTDTGVNSLLEGLENLGFGLNFTNIWDLIPYSFVIDWFVDVGSLLERIDTNLRILRLPIAYCTQSEKSVTTVTDLTSLGITDAFGHLSLTNYSRWTSHNVPLPPLKLEPDIKVQHHWLESAALILQRR